MIWLCILLLAGATDGIVVLAPSEAECEAIGEAVEHEVGDRSNLAWFCIAAEGDV